MTVDEYMTKMRELGYPRPWLNLWHDHETDRMKGSSGYRGTCGHGCYDKIYTSWGDVIQDVFDHVTRGGKKYRAR